MNKKGQTLAIGIMSAIVFFIIGMLTINFVMAAVTDARTDLNCASAATISDSTKLLCLAFDSAVPYWILLVLSVAFGTIIGRFAL